ncbi:MAG: FG-GAP repeat protein [Acidimicrobiales bacterium]|jgi:hypothetical protein
MQREVMLLRNSGIAALPMLVAVGAISLPLLASTASAAAASPRTTPPIGTQLAELKGSDTSAMDYFGSSVAISGTRLIVGAYGHAKQGGRAYVFTKTATGWKQAAELKGSDSAVGDWFGISVAISGTTAFVGAPGHAKSAGRAYVYTELAHGWRQTAELEGSDIVAGDYFGMSVAISGKTAVVGAWNHARGSGRAYVFTKTAAGWKQAAELKGSDTVAFDAFGISVAISASTVVVGAWYHAINAGRAYVFAKTTAGWKQIAELEGSDTVVMDYFGTSVAISGSTIIVGAQSHAANAGRAYVFTKTAAGWKQAAELKGSDTVATDYFGESVAISANCAVVGAPVHAKSAGRAYLFTKTASGWRQIAELKGSDTVAFDYLGPVSISGGTAIAGAGGHARNAGRAYVFQA